MEQSGLEWQDATYENKLATCADMVAALWVGKAFKPHIKEKLDSMDDLRVLADELVDFIDAATKKESNPELNRKMFVNQKVRAMGAMGAVMMGWLQ